MIHFVKKRQISSERNVNRLWNDCEHKAETWKFGEGHQFMMYMVSLFVYISVGVGQMTGFFYSRKWMMWIFLRSATEFCTQYMNIANKIYTYKKRAIKQSDANNQRNSEIER